MAKTEKIAAIILGVAAGVALVKFLRMPKEEREAFYDFLKNKTHDLLDDAEDTVEKVEHFMDEFKDKGEDEWIYKIYILKKMFKKLYGTEKRFLL